MLAQNTETSADVVDLFTDFDHYNPQIGEDGTPSAYFEAMRNQVLNGQRIGRSNKYGGMWIVGGYEECQEVMKMPDVFSNTRVIWPNYDIGDAVLLMAGQDDPEHDFYRKIFNKSFTPAKAHALRERIRAQANRLIDTFIDKGEMDVADGLCNELPGQLTAAFLGVPDDDGALYREWIDAMAQPIPEGGESNPKVAEMAKYVQRLIEKRRLNPGDDVFSDAVHANIEGRSLSDWELLSLFTLLLLAGFDNTFRMLSAAMWRLAWDTDLRRQLHGDPSLIPKAFDEVMRFYTPAHPTRKVMKDIEFHGIYMKEGDTVMICAPIANRDPARFDFPDNFIADRAINPHISLGSGLHRCLGAHLVRVEGQVMIEQVLKRIPEFRLDTREGKQPKWVGGQIAGFISVPIVF